MVLLHVWLQVLPKLACSSSQGSAAGGEKGSECLLQGPCSHAGGSALLQVHLNHGSTFCMPGFPFPGGPQWIL